MNRRERLNALVHIANKNEVIMKRYFCLPLFLTLPDEANTVLRGGRLHVHMHKCESWFLKYVEEPFSSG